MIAEIMRSINNFFETGYVDGEFTVNGGVISPVDALDDHAFVAVTGSEIDGVYRLDVGRLTDDNGDSPKNCKFTGRVYTLHPPAYFITLCDEIEAYKEKNPSGAYVTESFGGWSGTRATGAHGAATWQEAFADRLRPHRRMFTGVRL